MGENFRRCFKCGRSPANENVKLFRFPKPGVKNLLRCKLWAKYMFPEKSSDSIEFQKKLFSEHRMLCQYHFEPEDFTDSSMKKLSRNTFPCDKKSDSSVNTEPTVQSLSEKIFIPNKTPALTSSESQPGPSHRTPLMDIINTQPSSSTSTSRCSIRQRIKTPKDNLLFAKCAKYMRRVCQLRNTIKKLKDKAVLNILSDDNSVTKLSKKITPTFALLLQAQIRNFNRKGCGHRWKKEEKIVALRLYRRSPTCYRLLRKMFNLPSPGTLKVLLNRVPFGVGVSEPVLNVLNAFTKTLQPSDNEFVLMFDEMSLKKHFEYSSKQDLIEGFQDHGNQGRSPIVASYALVFMIAGIRKTVKQPIAHYFSSGFSTADRLAVLIKEVLYNCFQAGINIRATVCDMDGVNIKALTILGASSRQPVIKIQNREIFTIFDAPHLLKCFRNLFLKYDIECVADIASENKPGRGIAKWSHIKSFFEIDNSNPNFVFAPCLTKEHLDPNTQQKMKVKLAAQIFSHTVAAGLFSKISVGALSTDAVVTANLLSNMDKLFDSLNSNTADLRRGKLYATNIKTNTPHLKLFAQMRKFFMEVKFIGSSRRPPSQEGWIWTLNAIEDLFKTLVSKHKNITSLATRRLQQDPLENLFGCIRGNCGSNRNPTTIQFVAGLKTAILSRMAHVGTTGNCESDNNTIMNNFDKLLSLTKPASAAVAHSGLAGSTEHTTGNDLVLLTDDDISDNIDEDSAEVQACAYVCEFLLKRHKIECTNCKELFFAQNVEKHHLFVESREYSVFKSNLMYASKPMINCVEHCATAINKFLEVKGHHNHLKETITQSVQECVNFDFTNTCPSHKIENIKNIINNVFAICVKKFCIGKNRQFKDQTSACALRRKINILSHK